jgi:CHAT domain-containing protein/tetratricopeptide (TPR) repeat protein
VEPESYLDLAVTKWLARRWVDATSEHALDFLAKRFQERHGDLWLGDVLTARRSEKLNNGLAALAEAARANLADDWKGAVANGVEAAQQLRAAGSEAGALRADLEKAYALHRSGKSAAKCVAMAVAVERKAQASKYPWILGQAIMEQGICRQGQGDYGAAHGDIARALAVISKAGYRDLELRAEGMLAAMGTTAGDLYVAWNLGRAGLAKYWSGSSSGTRAQQIYGNLSRAAKSLDQRQAAYVFRKEETQAVSETPRRHSEAATRAVTGEFAMEAGLLEEARIQFDRAAKLFEQLQGTPDRQFETMAELYRAEAELVGGSPNEALLRLEAIHSAAEELEATQVRIRFQELLGRSLWQCGKPEEAEAAYRKAIDLTEESLSTLRGPRVRSEMLLADGAAYRGLVGILWDRGDRAGALRVWEWFRDAAGPGPRGKPDLDRRRPQLRSETFLAYAIQPGDVIGWWYDDRGIEGRRLGVKPEQLEAVALRFLRECADAASDPSALIRDGRQLYDWLVAPVADHLDSARTLVIEPDGPVGAVPLQALMDENFQYLGERFAIVTTSGLADYQRRETAGLVNASVKALVVANPALGRETTKTFPPLAGAMREGQSVAKRFRESLLLPGKRATLAALEQLCGRAELFHFAGHGFSNAGNGGLLLSPDDQEATGAGILDGTRMANQDWNRCKLAVLSACSTGTGEIKGPVNPESLVRGFLWAGVARVVASRWNMDTETSVTFMDCFYENLLSGSSPAVALQHAARRVRENQAKRHPYFWAGFQGFGAR